MKYNVRNEIEGPIDAVIKIGLDRDRDVRVYPNVTDTKVLSREEKDNKLFVKIKSVGNGDIPPALRGLIKPDLLSWLEEGVFDFTKNEYNYTVKHAKFANVFKMTGRMVFESLGENRTARTLYGDLQINIPILGPIAEKKIVEIQKDNLALDIKAMKEEVKAYVK